MNKLIALGLAASFVTAFAASIPSFAADTTNAPKTEVKSEKKATKSKIKHSKKAAKTETKGAAEQPTTK
jgi:hypothetical protein